MHDLQLVGFTTDRRGLIFRTATGAPGDSFVVPLTPELVAVVGELAAEAPELPDVEAAPPAGTAEPAPAEDAARPRSLLSVRDIQARLRAGEPVAQVAREAGVDDEWIERFAPPVRAEQQRIVERALDAHLQRARGAPSALPLRRAVGLAMAERGVAFTVAAFEEAWTSHLLGHDRWAVDFAYRHRGSRTARWIFDASTGALTTTDRAAAQLGYVPETARRAVDVAEEVDGIVGDPNATSPITTEAETPPAPARRRARTSTRGPAPAAGGTPSGERGVPGRAPRATAGSERRTAAPSGSTGRKRRGAATSAGNRSASSRTVTTEKAAGAKKAGAKSAGPKKAGAKSAGPKKAGAKKAGAEKAARTKKVGTAKKAAGARKAAPTKQLGTAGRSARTTKGARATKAGRATKAAGATKTARATAGGTAKRAPGAAGKAGAAGAAGSAPRPGTARNPGAQRAAGSTSGTRAGTGVAEPVPAGNGRTPGPSPSAGSRTANGTSASRRSTSRSADIPSADGTGAAGPRYAGARRAARAASTGKPAVVGRPAGTGSGAPSTVRALAAAAPPERPPAPAPATSGRTHPAPPADGRPVAARAGEIDLGHVPLAASPPASRASQPEPSPDAGVPAAADRTDARRARAAERSAATVQFRSGSAIPVRRGDRTGGTAAPRRRQLRAR